MYICRIICYFASDFINLQKKKNYPVLTFQLKSQFKVRFSLFLPVVSSFINSWHWGHTEKNAQLWYPRRDRCIHPDFSPSDFTWPDFSDGQWYHEQQLQSFVFTKNTLKYYVCFWNSLILNASRMWWSPKKSFNHLTWKTDGKTENVKSTENKNKIWHVWANL